MKLQEFLYLIEDEEARIELEIDGEEDYQYLHFWLSDFRDFRTSDDITKYYKNFNVISFSFIPEQEINADIRIYIKP